MTGDDAIVIALVITALCAPAIADKTGRVLQRRREQADPLWAAYHRPARQDHDRNTNERTDQ
jgi:hypothetical protein